jgi:hypothetical protein
VEELAMRQFYRKRRGLSGSSMQLGVGGALIAASTYLVYTEGRGHGAMLFGLILAVIGVWSRTAPIVVLEDEWVDLQPTLLSRRLRVRFRDVGQLLEESPGNVFLIIGPDRLRVPVGALEPEDQAALLSALRAAVAGPGLGRR